MLEKTKRAEALSRKNQPNNFYKLWWEPIPKRKHEEDEGKAHQNPIDGVVSDGSSLLSQLIRKFPNQYVGKPAEDADDTDP